MEGRVAPANGTEDRSCGAKGPGRLSSVCCAVVADCLTLFCCFAALHPHTRQDIEQAVGVGRRIASAMVKYFEHQGRAAGGVLGEGGGGASRFSFSLAAA